MAAGHAVGEAVAIREIGVVGDPKSGRSAARENGGERRRRRTSTNSLIFVLVVVNIVWFGDVDDQCAMEFFVSRGEVIMFLFVHFELFVVIFLILINNIVVVV